MSGIDDWLERLGLGAHADVFRENDVDLEALPHLTDAMLKEMGLSIGVRAKVLAGIAALGSDRADPGNASAEPRAAPAEKRAIGRRDAERRHLTVMFSDLVGSTALTEALDPEDLRVLVRTYQAVSGETIALYDGHVALHMGDGIMAYFGWPAAHEDDAERAVRAALDLMQRVKMVHAPSPLRLRIGIATGVVVVGEGPDSEPDFAVGETPNLAARLQTLAGPDQIVISPATRRLVSGIFDLAEMGSYELKGFARPVEATRVFGVARVEGRFRKRVQRLAPLTGREPEIGILLDRWASALDGDGQLVLLEGEAGFGKSRLVRELCARIEGDPHAEIFHQCSPFHASAAFHPIIEQIEFSAGFQPDDDVHARLEKMEALVPGPDRARALFAALLSLDTDRYGPLGLTPLRQKELTVHALVDRLEEIAARAPALLIVEDAHWIDPTTEEAFGLQFSALAKLPVLAIVTFRPEYECPWARLPHATPLRLPRLGRRHARAMVDALGEGLSDEVRDRIVSSTDGVPLFVEEMTLAIRTSPAAERVDGGHGVARPPAATAIPSTLHDSLTAQLDRLGAVKEVAQIASCIGRRFTASLLAAAMGVPEPALEPALAVLVDGGLVHRDGAGYAFKHYLVQQAAYAGLLKSSRREVHGRIAEALIARHDRDRRYDPLAIAQHLRAADKVSAALPWLLRAAERAGSSGAARESMEILNRALGMVEEIRGSQGERDRAELELLMAKLPVCIALEGWAGDEGREVCSRALDLALALGDKDRESAILYQVATMHEVRGEYSDTQEVLARRSAVLGQSPAAEPAVESGELMACSTFYQGRFDVSIAHATQALDHADSGIQTALGTTVSEDPTIACLFWIAKSLLLQGHIERARARHREAVDFARRSRAWYAESQAAVDAALFAALQRDADMALDNAKRAAELSARVGLSYREAVAVLIGEWAGAQAEDRSADMGKVFASLEIFRKAGAMIGYGFYLSLAAEAHARLGEWGKCAELVEEGLRSCADSRGFFYESELHRLRGAVAEARDGLGSPSLADERYFEALEVARAQGARLLQLRISNAMARMWIERGRVEEARRLLRPVHDWFAVDTVIPDLAEARSLLARMGG